MKKTIRIILVILFIINSISLYGQNQRDTIITNGDVMIFLTHQKGLFADLRVGSNLVPLAGGLNPEIMVGFRPSRFFVVSVHSGATFKPGTENSFNGNQYLQGYKVYGSFIKLGIKNYLLNTFYSSKYDLFTGLYYIGSFTNEELPINNNIQKNSYGTNALAIHSGLGFRLNKRFILDVGMQYTFLSDKKEKNPTYIPGIGRRENDHAWQGIFTLQYVIPIPAIRICCICHEEDGSWRYCPCWWVHKSTRHL